MFAITQKKLTVIYQQYIGGTWRGRALFWYQRNMKVAKSHQEEISTVLISPVESEVQVSTESIMQRLQLKRTMSHVYHEQPKNGGKMGHATAAESGNWTTREWHDHKLLLFL